MLPSVRATPNRRPAGPVIPPVPLGTVLNRLDDGSCGCDASTRAPSKRSPEPRCAWYTPGRMKRLTGRKIAPATGAPRSSTPIEHANIPSPLMKFDVPSSGSITHTTSASSGPASSRSSPTTPCSGNRCATSARTMSSIARSTSVTGSSARSSLYCTCSAD